MQKAHKKALETPGPFRKRDPTRAICTKSRIFISDLGSGAILVILLFLFGVGRSRQERAIAAFEFFELAFFHDLGRAALPGRVGFGINVEAHYIAGLAPGGAGFVFGAIGHHHGDVMIVGVDVFFHHRSLWLLESVKTGFLARFIRDFGLHCNKNCGNNGRNIGLFIVIMFNIDIWGGFGIYYRLNAIKYEGVVMDVFRRAAGNKPKITCVLEGNILHPTSEAIKLAAWGKRGGECNDRTAALSRMVEKVQDGYARGRHVSEGLVTCIIRLAEFIDKLPREQSNHPLRRVDRESTAIASQELVLPLVNSIHETIHGKPKIKPRGYVSQEEGLVNFAALQARFAARCGANP